MRYRILHHGRKWPRPENHLDGRVCPECRATVHGRHGQKGHEDWHADLAGLLNDLSERSGLEKAEEQPWTAVVDDDAEPLDAIGG